MTEDRKMGGYLFYFLTFVIGVGVGFGIFQAINWYYKKSILNTPESPSKKEAQSVFALSKNVSASLVWWDQDNGFETIKKNKDKISTLTPFWYKIKEDGSVQKFTGAEDEEVIQFTQNNKIKIIPTITNDCEPHDVEQVIKKDDLVNKHIENIMNLVEKNSYDGINIDYECLTGESVRDYYSSFIRKLSERLHAKSKILVVALHAKSSDMGAWEGPATQDWELLGEASDQVKIMTYDYHWSTSEAGDIAPISWMEEILSYATKNIDPKKIYLGINFYGYDWIEKQAKDLTYNNVLELINRFNLEIKLSSEKEKYFTYTDNNEDHTVYFADHETITERIKLVEKYQIAGIGIWRLGQEDPKNWEVITELLK